MNIQALFGDNHLAQYNGCVLFLSTQSGLHYKLMRSGRDTQRRLEASSFLQVFEVELEDKSSSCLFIAQSYLQNFPKSPLSWNCLLEVFMLQSSLREFSECL